MKVPLAVSIFVAAYACPVTAVFFANVRFMNVFVDPPWANRLKIFVRIAVVVGVAITLLKQVLYIALPFAFLPVWQVFIYGVLLRDFRIQNNREPIDVLGVPGKIDWIDRRFSMGYALIGIVLPFVVAAVVAANLRG